jgi:hypothetical protein
MPELGTYIELTTDAKVHLYDAGVWTKEEIDAGRAKAKEWAKLFNWETDL